MSEFLKKLPKDKIKMNWNKRPIKMDDFLSFLTVETRRGSGHLGEDNGWTKHYGDNGLEISGGFVKKIEYLDSIRYGKNLNNPCNNFVNPFYLFDIVNESGKKFFLDYYSEEIEAELQSATSNLSRAEEYKKELFEFWEEMGVAV